MKNLSKIFTWLMIVLAVVGFALVVWGYAAGWEKNNGLASDALLTFAYIMVGIAILAILAGVVIGGMNDPKSLVRLGIAVVAIAALCFVVYLIAPGTPAKGLLIEQPGTGTLKLTDTVLYLAYLLAIAAVIAIAVGEVRMAITNKKG
ncbi:MAG: hypothetical protein K6F58_04920 [Bacteroidales bacterium]|nr:hypothetical protein [Bacteroidales bacterium]